VAGIGRFDGNPGADMLFWHDNYLDISSGGAGAPQRQSRQDMANKKQTGINHCYSTSSRQTDAMR
jgi:hypothetical protein